jgi:acyl-coenzyme A synthetase/AMP-(fatty) acid ligase
MLLDSGRTHAVAIDADARVYDREATARAIAPIARALAGHTEVIVACSDRLRFVHAALGVWASGAAVALPPNLLPATVEALAGRRGATVLHDGEHGLGIDVRTMAPGAAIAMPAWDPARHFACIATSGTTGVPKLIRKTAGQLLGEATVLAQAFDLAGARVLCTVPPHHIYGLLFGVLVPLLADATIVAVAALHPEAVVHAIDRFGVDVVVSTPAQLRAFDVLDDGALARVRRVFSSGAPLPGDTAAMLRDRLGVSATEVFGSSETGGIATRTHVRADPPWLPLPGVEVDADPDGRMRVRSPWLDPDVAQPFVTEDRIAVDGGAFVHLGRSDDVVKIGGRRIALGDVTAKLLALAGVTDAAAIAVPTRDARGLAIAAFVATTTLDADAVRSELSRWFDASVLPRRIVCLPALPREATGKLARASLLASLGADTPRVHTVSVDGDLATFDVDIDEALPCFDGHFPGDPVLPGAVLLDTIMRAIALAWPQRGTPSVVRRAKFTDRVRPGDRLRLELRCEADEAMFTVDRTAPIGGAGNRCAIGSFAFGSTGDVAAR